MKKHSYARLGKYALLLAGASMLPAIAQAQDAQPNAGAQNGLADIVVTAQKRSENLQNVPIAVTAVSGSQLANAGVVSTATLSSAVAGLSVNTTANYFAPHIRGVGTASFGPAVENPVALYVDGVYYASQLIAPTDLSDVDQVAVLKGPQGTLFGRNATGGVIQMTTRDPSSEFGGEVKTELDQYLTSRNFLYVTGGLSDDVKTNLSVKYTTQGEGWGKNLVTGNDIHKINHDFAVRNKWTLTPTDTTTVKISGDYGTYTNSLGPNLRPYGTATPTTPGLITTIAETGNPYDSANYVDNLSRLNSGGASLTIDQDVGFAHAISITAYRQYKFSALFDAAASSVPVSGADFKQRGKQFSQEIQLVSTDTKPINWAIGGYYFHGRENLNGNVALIYTPLTDPAFGGFGGNVNAFFYDTRLTTDSIAGFAQATWEIVEGTRVTGGIRYTHEKRKYAGIQEGIVDGDTVNPVFVDSVTDSVKASKWTFRAAIDQDIAEHAMIYASFNRGFKSGGFNGLSASLHDPAYKPEQLDAYEVGAKMDLLDRTLRLNPSVFYYDYKNIQVTQFQANSTFIRNGAKAELYGADLDLEWRPVEPLTFNANAEWIHSKFKSFPNAPAYFPDTVNGGNIPGTVDAAGNQLPFTPKFSLNVGANYTLHVANAKLDFNVANSYNSGFRTEADNRLRQKSYNWLNASVTWTAPGDRLSAGFWGRNLLNKAVVTQLSGFANADTADYANPPRTYGVTLRYKFGGFN